MNDKILLSSLKALTSRTEVHGPSLGQALVSLGVTWWMAQPASLDHHGKLSRLKGAKNEILESLSPHHQHQTHTTSLPCCSGKLTPSQ